MAQNASSKNATTSFSGKLKPRRYMLESRHKKIAEQLKRNCNSAVTDAAQPLISLTGLTDKKKIEITGMVSRYSLVV